MLTVTRLEPQKKNPQRLNVYLDGEFAFGIHRAAAPWLTEGDQLTLQKVKDLKTQDQTESAYQRALNFLSYRVRSSQEVRRNLVKHEVEDPIIEAVLERLRQASLVDDQAFARQWVENRSQFKPRGKKALSSELYQKGIPQAIISETLEELDEETLAWKCARKKAAQYETMQKEEFQSKLYGFLNRRGFPYSICQDVVGSLWEELSKESS
ncbi:MAG: regulatory protein RecX [Anaerolineales bacterium]|jgi:regulatory protein